MPLPAASCMTSKSTWNGVDGASTRCEKHSVVECRATSSVSPITGEKSSQHLPLIKVHEPLTSSIFGFCGPQNWGTEFEIIGHPPSGARADSVPLSRDPCCLGIFPFVQGCSLHDFDLFTFPSSEAVQVTSPHSVFEPVGLRAEASYLEPGLHSWLPSFSDIATVPPW